MRALAPLLAFVLKEKSLRQNLRAFAQFLAVIAATVVVFSVAFRAIMHFVEHREYSWVTVLSPHVLPQSRPEIPQTTA